MELIINNIEVFNNFLVFLIVILLTSVVFYLTSRYEGIINRYNKLLNNAMDHNNDLLEKLLEHQKKDGGET